MSSECTHCASLPTCAKGLRLTVPRSVHNGVPAESLLVSGVFTALVLVLRLRSSPCEVRRHAMSSIQSTMRTCTRGASGAGVSVPAARGIPNSRAPSCHLERACRLRLAAGTRAAPQRSWHFLRTLSVSVIGDSSGAGMSLKPSVPGSGRLWDPPSHAGRPCGTPARACTASAWMDQIRGEAVRLMSSEGSAAVYFLFVQASQSALAQNQRSSHNSSALESRNNHPAGCGPQCRPRDREWATLTARR